MYNLGVVMIDIVDHLCLQYRVMLMVSCAIQSIGGIFSIDAYDQK